MHAWCLLELKRTDRSPRRSRPYKASLKTEVTGSYCACTVTIMSTQNTQTMTVMALMPKARSGNHQSAAAQPFRRPSEVDEEVSASFFVKNRVNSNNKKPQHVTILRVSLSASSPKIELMKTKIKKSLPKKALLV